MSNHYYNYMTCFFCIILMAIMLVIAAVTQHEYSKGLERQNEKVLQLKSDSIIMSKAIIHLTQWHEMSSKKQQREFINQSKLIRHDR